MPVYTPTVICWPLTWCEHKRICGWNKQTYLLESLRIHNSCSLESSISQRNSFFQKIQPDFELCVELNDFDRVLCDCIADWWHLIQLFAGVWTLMQQSYQSKFACMKTPPNCDEAVLRAFRLNDCSSWTNVISSMSVCWCPISNYLQRKTCGCKSIISINCGCDFMSRMIDALKSQDTNAFITSFVCSISAGIHFASDSVE